MADEKKIGVFICSAFGIAEAIDCEKLAEETKALEGVHTVKIMKDLCTANGAEQVQKDIEADELDGVVIAASSPRYHAEYFKFPNTLVERVNIRELVAWTQKPNNDDTFALALDYVKMGLAKVKGMSHPEPRVFDIIDTVMVIGGGYTGLNAAKAAARAGYPVVLVEKKEQLGGFYKRMYKLTPTGDPYMDLETNTIDELIADVVADEKIRVFTGCSIEKTTGQPGLFDVTAKMNDSTIDFQVGSIIQATGWKPTNPKRMKFLGYGTHKNIITNLEMEDLAREDNLKRPSDGKDISSAVIIINAGEDDDIQMLFSSTITSMAGLKHAMYLREKYPNAQIYVVYKHMRTPGQYEMFYKRVQNEDNIFITRGEVKKVAAGDNDEILVDIDNTLIGENIQVSADLVVLPQGMMPATALETEDEMKQKTEAAAEETAEENKEAEGEEDAIEEMPVSNVLNLTYRQGPELPVLKYGYPDSHYICFPYETRRTAIYAAGTARTPMDHVQCKNDALGAAMKAIQAIENVRRGTALHPRSGEKAWAEFFLQRCTQCKRCTEECPFGTLDEDTKGTPKYNPNRCRRCGICMGACPERIISFQDFSVQIISSVIKSIYIPTEEEDGEATPRIIAFMCENDAYPALDMLAAKHIELPSYFRIIPVRCLGSISTSWIADSLSQGFDGALLIGCKYGDDYQCHYIKGSELANKRMENVQEKLKQLVLEPERVEIHNLAIDEYDRIPDIMHKFAKVIEEVGPNPYKEM